MIGIERRFSDDTRLIDLTVGDLKELITSLISKIKQIEEKRYVYGLQGLNPEKPDVPLNKNDAFQKVQKRRVQEKR